MHFAMPGNMVNFQSSTQGRKYSYAVCSLCAWLPLVLSGRAEAGAFLPIQEHLSAGTQHTGRCICKQSKCLHHSHCEDQVRHRSYASTTQKHEEEGSFLSSSASCTRITVLGLLTLQRNSMTKKQLRFGGLHFHAAVPH